MAAAISDPTSRRAVILAGLAALVGATAELATRPMPALANDPNDVTKGVVNHATNVTTLINDSERGTGLTVRGDGIGMIVTAGGDDGIGMQLGGATGLQVEGEIAIQASGDLQGISAGGREAILGSGDDVGVHGTGDIAGIMGESGNGYAVLGTASAPNLPAILGWSTAQQSGVQGYSADSAHHPGPPPARTGVYGYAAQDATARGVYGQSTIGRGVEGHATSGLGMVASATSGTALQASAASNAWALRTTAGRVGFSTAGLATIGAGMSTVTVSPGFDIGPDSKVLAVLQGDPGAATVLHHVSRDVGNDRFTVHLTASAVAATPVAWFVIG
jgi:hypothetical protein